MIDIIPSTVTHTLALESETHITQVEDPLVDQVVDPISHSVNPTLPVESELHTAPVLLVTSDYSMLGGVSLVSTEPHPNTKVVSFDWSIMTEPFLPSSTPF